MRWVRGILAYAAAVVLTTALACMSSAHFVLWALSADLGIEIGLGRWLATMAKDAIGMGPFYGGIIAFAFLIALPVAALIIKWLRRRGHAGLNLHYIGFVSAGAVAVLTALLTVQGLLEVMPVAGARTAVGLAAQILAGALGGLLFARLTRGLAEGSSESG